jgi:hypothetical protein
MKGSPGVPSDPAEAVLLLQRAADAGNIRAMTVLAMSFCQGVPGIGKKPKEALVLFNKAIELASNNDNAVYNLGVAFFRGDVGTGKPSKAEAFSCFQKAASMGNVAAILAVAVCFQKGEGVAQNPDLALEWYEKAIAKGNLIAMCTLGSMYAKGDGLQADVEKVCFGFMTQHMASTETFTHLCALLLLFLCSPKQIPKNYARRSTCTAVQPKVAILLPWVSYQIIMKRVWACQRIPRRLDLAVSLCFLLRKACANGFSFFFFSFTHSIKLTRPSDGMKSPREERLGLQIQTKPSSINSQVFPSEY